MGLQQYQQMRRFNETPEPKGQQSRQGQPAGSLRFVIQKHQATRLHYDFRLEMEGVLKSWAVPKGPSLNPKDKRLAMMTEDHPIDYRKFEGTIPEGNYGAGEVIVWDEGTYEAEGSRGRKDSEQKMLAGLKAGQMTFVMQGKKINGLFSLVKLKRGEANAWLLVKKSDEFASTEDVTQDMSSVLSDKYLSDKKPGKRGKDAMPHQIKPMLATLVAEPFDDKDWIFELKFDGYRAIAEVDTGNVQLYSRNLQPFSERYLEVVEALQAIKQTVVLDGEIVVVDDSGKTSFQALQNYRKTKQGQLRYYVFDLLYLDGRDLRNLPLLQRKQLLRGIIPPRSIIQYSDHVTEEGQTFFAAAKKQGLEGIIAKNSQSVYRVGVRCEDWLKIKTHRRQEAVIAGFTEPRNSRKFFGSLVLGVYDEEKNLVYVGHTGTGFNHASLKDIYAKLMRLRQKQSPFARAPKTNMPVTWVKPELVCEVEFTEWTEDGLMRHPSFQGLRIDKPAQQVVREKEVATEQAIDHTINHSLTMPFIPTNLQKIYWPKERYTKGQLINYYQAISKVILPYLKDRPQSLHRHPNGINGESFFQKNITTKVPEFVQTTKLVLETEKKSITSILCNNQETLLYLANLGCIEINPWNSKVKKIDYPDWAVIDLDPGKIGFDKVIETAIETRKLLDKIDVPSYPKTSGKTGLHIFIPMGAKYDYDQVKQFVEILVKLINTKLPKTTSVERSPSKRTRLIYLDYLQNRIGQTLAAPYSVRPWPGATVSAPLQWKEVKRGLDPAKFTMKNIFKRLDKLGDLWQPVIGTGIDLQAALNNLSKLVKK
jgi:bifunctional non-homologous end joining protein LigD